MRPIAGNPREAAMNLIFLDTPPTTDQELSTTIISRTHTETTAPTTLTGTPPHLPTNKITIHIEGRPGPPKTDIATKTGLTSATMSYHLL
ncbi:hypothetical protein TWF706_006023 [Orbilia oligospora]|nr:hypothetical protein TWF706_006023 [Orbilia oligospora]